MDMAYNLIVARYWFVAVPWAVGSWDMHWCSVIIEAVLNWGIANLNGRTENVELQT